MELGQRALRDSDELLRDARDNLTSPPSSTNRRSQRPANLLQLHNRDRPPNVRQLVNLHSHTELDHGDLPHRLDGEVNVLEDELQLRHLQTKPCLDHQCTQVPMKPW